jgi:hypothetical protein
MRGCALMLLLVTAVPAAAKAEAVGAAEWVSPLALPRVEGSGDPELILAQRAIDREWPAPGDSGVTLMTDGKSEMAAMVFSATAPGTGQLYAGSWSGLVFAAVEVVGWLGWHSMRQDAEDLRDQARVFAGTPTDSASAWSFTRYEQATQSDALKLRALYSVDRDAFDEAIASDPQYAEGWAAPADQTEFKDLRDRSDTHLSRSRVAESGLWINHVVAALDALRAARIHNRALGHGLELKAKGGWQHGRPEMMVTLQRRF